ncbi:MAG: ribosome maturation factor RimP [Cytophagaceae bacterium]
MDLKAKIEELTGQFLNNPALFLVEVLIGGNSGMRKITVVLDGEPSISIEECAAVSRKLGHELEESNIIDSPYLLEVGSPGLDQPLKLKRQYQKNVGRKLSVQLADDSIKTGKLEEVTPDFIRIQAESKEVKSNGKPGKKIVTVPVEIPFSDIKKSNVVVSFN